MFTFIPFALANWAGHVDRVTAALGATCPCWSTARYTYRQVPATFT